MSILRVANLQFNASGTRRIDYDSVADDGIIKVSAAAVKLPVGDNASRPTSQAGIVRYNSDTGYMEFGGATSWVPVASNAAFDIANAAFTMANVAYNAQNVDYTLSNTAFGVANAAYASVNSNWTVTNTVYGVANAAFASANNVGPQLAPAYNTANAAFALANTHLANTSGVSFNGNFFIPSGSLGVGNTTPGPAKVHITSANTVGGVGYADFLRVTNNSYPSVTNPVKTFRLNQTGSIEIINNAYTAVIASLDDSGNFATGSRGISKGSMPAGSVLQVQSVTKTSVFSTTSTTYIDVTGLSVSITPSSSTSKILVLASVSLGAGNILTSARLVRDSTALGIGDAAGSRIQTSVAYVGGGGVSGIDGMAPVQNINYLDSPSTVNSTTYKIQMQVSGGTGYLNQASDDQNAAYRPRMSSTITVMEIAQ